MCTHLGLYDSLSNGWESEGAWPAERGNRAVCVSVHVTRVGGALGRPTVALILGLETTGVLPRRGLGQHTADVAQGHGLTLLEVTHSSAHTTCTPHVHATVSIGDVADARGPGFLLPG